MQQKVVNGFILTSKRLPTVLRTDKNPLNSHTLFPKKIYQTRISARQSPINTANIFLLLIYWKNIQLFIGAENGHSFLATKYKQNVGHGGGPCLELLSSTYHSMRVCGSVIVVLQGLPISWFHFINIAYFIAMLVYIHESAVKMAWTTVTSFAECMHSVKMIDGFNVA